MNQLKLKYNIEDKPTLPQLIMYGLQWLAVAIPMIIIVGKVVASLHYNDPTQQIVYIQKVFFIIGLSILLQVTLGHRLPLVIGPASVLLVGITASQGSSLSTIYTSILIGGLLLAILSISGLFSYLKRLFTPRVIVTILMMIAFTLTPMIIKLIFTDAPNASMVTHLLFYLSLIFLMFVANKYLRGFWKSTLIIWAMVFGSLLYMFLFNPSVTSINQNNLPFFSGFFKDFNTSLSFDIGTLISFIICFLALAINDLGSIQSIGEMLNIDKLSKRTSRGITLTGLLNVISGFFGVIGPVSYSLSPGVIASTGVASRFALIPAGVGLVGMAFIPAAIDIIGAIPTAVIASTFTYVLCSQLAAGFLLAFNSMQNFKLENGLVLGLPLMLSVIISFLPEEAVNSFPLWLKPVLGNGFVVGVVAVLIMEHVIYRKQK